MFKYIIRTMGDIDWMAITPQLIFMTVFVLMVVVWFRKGRKEIADMSNLPLEDGTKK